MDGSNVNGRKGKRGGRMVDMGLVVGVGALSAWGLVESFTVRGRVRRIILERDAESSA